MKTKEVVKELLMNHPKLRDSDNNLISTYWFKELQLKGINTKDITAFELLKMYADGKLTNAETIRRMRAKLQEDCDSLRGKKYNERKGIFQENFRKELGYGMKAEEIPQFKGTLEDLNDLTINKTIKL